VRLAGGDSRGFSKFIERTLTKFFSNYQDEEKMKEWPKMF